ncbi:uncharacterized protein PV07_00263 [Cladophialophora immunda]|uniref:Uncharacterized protein n=1 Tax=Cladophialophora immunda TaxID=569365 RepID=A0A0D1ZZ53_9EURO|nr:uncharacterized protein PV07_00263 [Cladophialophora immunda]KIW33411.1 hypothetical protein PV07_00263 [Cladophialophora immunda]
MRRHRDLDQTHGVNMVQDALWLASEVQLQARARSTSPTTRSSSTLKRQTVGARRSSGRDRRGTKSIKIPTLITFTIIYFVFILEPTHGHGTPLDGFRVWFFGKSSTLSQLPDSTRVEAGKLTEEDEKKLNDRAKVDADVTADNSGVGVEVIIKKGRGRPQANYG